MCPKSQPHLTIDQLDWFANQCQKIGGSNVTPDLCYVPKKVGSYEYFVTPPPLFLIDMDQNIKRYRKWWWIGLIIVLIIFPIITFQWWGWQTVNSFFVIIVAFAFVVYGNRVSRTWLTLSIIITIVSLAALSYLIYTVVVYDLWYPPVADFYCHVILGFALYIVVSIFKPQWNFLSKFVGAMGLSILYEILEWYTMTFYGMLYLWWDLPNTLYDLQNNVIGCAIAIVIEVILNRWKFKYYKQTHSNFLRQ